MTDYRAREGGMDWRTFRQAQPEHGQRCRAVIAGVEHSVVLSRLGDELVWMWPRGGAMNAFPSDEWRPEDDR